MRLPFLLLGLVLLASHELPAQSRLVVVVRHAEKAAEPAADPGLTDAGRARAAALAAALADARVGAVITTQFRRTQETAAPLGRAPIVVPASRDLAAHARAIADSVRARPAGETVLIVGHSNTVPAIIRALGGPALPDLCDGEYSRLFLLQVNPEGGAAMVRASLGTPDPEEGCRSMR